MNDAVENLIVWLVATLAVSCDVGLNDTLAVYASFVTIELFLHDAGALLDDRVKNRLFKIGVFFWTPAAASWISIGRNMLFSSLLNPFPMMSSKYLRCMEEERTPTGRN